MRKVRHGRRIRRIIVFMAVLLIGCFGISLWQSKYSLTCSSYSIKSSKLESPIRVLQITDLHNSVFGKNNRRLIDLSAEQTPDLILITGDLLNSDETETDTVTELISALTEIAPVYVSLGNHEIEYEENYGTDIAGFYEAAGAVVLDKQFLDLTVGGQAIRLGGVYGYCLPEKYLETGEADSEECAFLSEFQNTGRYTVLMCHMPVCWLINDSLDEWDIDCVFSGHVHGGELILPWIGGIYAPDMGWFPGRLEGVYHSDDGTGTLVLSRGLGTREWIPRFNNVPEIVVVDFLPA